MLDTRYLKAKARVTIKMACCQLENKYTNDAFTSYGMALAFEEMYDSQQDNPDINTLYRDDKEYREWFLKWVQLKKDLVP